MLGIIGGGNMGEALIKGIISSQIFSPEKIIVSEILDKRRNYLEKSYKIKTTLKIEELLDKAEIVIFAVKPQIIDTVLDEIKGYNMDNKLFISIAAGVKIEKFEKYLGKDKKIIRVMPNTCAFVLESISALSPNKNIDENDLKIALKIFNAIGETVVVPEYQQDPITGLSGSGPGYVATIMEAFIDAGVLSGLSRDIAEKLVIQTFLGTIKLKLESDKNFYEIKSMVTSPGGTTISGIHELEKGNLRATIMNCVKEATNKSKELS